MEVITRSAVMLMSAAAEKLGLSAEDPDESPHRDLDEARRLITALAGLVTASAEYLGPHAGPVRDGLKSLQLAFRESSAPRRTNRATGQARIHRPRLVILPDPLLTSAVPTISLVERISSRPMTLTSPARTRRTSRYWWVPAAAGWTVGVIATLSLLASISPSIRWVIRVPREFVNDYIFNFPDTSFAWAFVLALLAAALAARKRIAWLILVAYMVAALGWNIGDLVTGEETIIEDIGEVIGLGVADCRDLVPAAGPQGILGQGAPGRTAEGGHRPGRRDGDRHARRVGPAGVLPRLSGPR